MIGGFVINVAVSRTPIHQPKRYEHLFRTDAIQDPSDTRLALIELQAAFPAPHYSVECTRWDCRGGKVQLDQLGV